MRNLICCFVLEDLECDGVSNIADRQADYVRCNNH